MNVYVDSSALLKRYVLEAGTELVATTLDQAALAVTGAHTTVEIRRNLSRLLAGSDLTAARRQFERDLDRLGVLALDAVTCEAAAVIVESTGVRSLDACCTSGLRNGQEVRHWPSSRSTRARRTPPALSGSPWSAPEPGSLRSAVARAPIPARGPGGSDDDRAGGHEGPGDGQVAAQLHRGVGHGRPREQPPCRVR